MNPADIAILIVIGISTLIGLFRGLVREVLSLAGFVVAFWAAFAFTGVVGAAFERWISSPSIRWVVAFLIVFAGVLALAAAINMLIGKLVDKSGMSTMDRLLGSVFGIGRGAVIVCIVVFVGQLLPFLTREALWRESTMIPFFERLSAAIVELLPEDLKNEVRVTAVVRERSSADVR